MARRYKCPYCDDKYERKDLIEHIDKKHEDLIPENFTSTRIVFNLINKRECGFCRVCNKETKWREDLGRYDVLCENPKCKEELRRRYQENMIRVRGTDNILNDPEQQKKMLANRSISGKYKFTNGGVLTFTGSYEKKCLEFMDKVLEIPSKDILSPGPTLEYEMNGEKHFYITDFYLIPQNLIIEVKDGGDNLNTKDTPGMRSSRERTLAKEKLITESGEYNYIRLTNNNFAQLLDVLMEIKEAQFDKRDGKIIKVNESYIIETDEDNYKFLDVKKDKSEVLKYLKKSNISYAEDIIENYIGEIIVYKDKMIGRIFIGNKKDKGFIVDLDISKTYRGQKLGNKLIDDAIKKYNGIDLLVDKDNEIALHMYKKRGFVIVKEINNQYYMKLKSKITKDNKVNESYITEADEDTLEQIKKFNKELCTYEYIIVKPNGEVITKIKQDDFKNYNILSPSKFKRYRGGICWDYVVYENANFPNVKHKTFFFCMVDKDGNPKHTHTFLLFYLNDKTYWFESSWKSNMGIFEFNNEDEALSFIINKLSSAQSDKGDYYVVDYKPNKYIGMSENEFLESMSKLPEYNYKTVKNPSHNVIQSIKVKNGKIVESVINESSSITLYHGTDNPDFDLILPNSYNVGTHTSKPRMSSYWFNNAEYAKIFATMTVLDNNLPKDPNARVCLDNDMSILVPNKYKITTINLLKNSNGYVYYRTITNKSVISRGHARYFPEYTIDVPIKPDGIIKVSYKDMINNIKFVDQEYYEEVMRKYATDNIHYDVSIFQQIFDIVTKYSTGDIAKRKRELKKLSKFNSLGESVIEESSNMVYRVTYNGEGIYEALHKNVDFNTWKSILSSNKVNWLPKPPEYINGYKSYFTEYGYKKFCKLTLPLIAKYLDKDKITIMEYNIEGEVVYSDKYQIVIDDSAVSLNESDIEYLNNYIL